MLLLNSHKPLKGKVSENELFNEKKKKKRKVFYLFNCEFIKSSMI